MKKRNGVQLKLPMHTRAKVNLQPPQATSGYGNSAIGSE